MRYPLGEYEKDRIRSKTGKKLTDINLDEIRKGNIVAEDIKISKETLKMQAQVARKADNVELAMNFDRAAELVNIPDDIILEMYNKMRPNRSTKEELLEMAKVLIKEYNATECGQLVLEAVEIYEKRGVLL